MPPRFLLDENIPAELGALLRERGHDVIGVPAALRGADDAEVLNLAVREARILVTLDRDFGELVFLHQKPAPPAVVLIRMRATQIVVRVGIVSDAIERTATQPGVFVVIDGDEVRLRPLPP